MFFRQDETRQIFGFRCLARCVVSFLPAWPFGLARLRGACSRTGCGDVLTPKKIIRGKKMEKQRVINQKKTYLNGNMAWGNSKNIFWRCHNRSQLHFDHFVPDANIAKQLYHCVFVHRGCIPATGQCIFCLGNFHSLKGRPLTFPDCFNGRLLWPSI